MKLCKYYIADKKGRGLHYVCGELFWDKPKDIETVEEYTSFKDPFEAAEFALERNIPGPVNIRTITYTIS